MLLPARIAVLSGSMILAVVAAPAMGQSLSERIEHVKRQQQAQKQAEAALANMTLGADYSNVRHTADRLGDVIENVDIQGVSARSTFRWFSRVTGISLVIHWERLAEAGVDPEKPITLQLTHVPAGQLLALLMKQIEPELDPLMYETTPWYIQIITRSEANRKTVTRVYLVDDILHNAPNFDNAPKFDLASALSGDNIGGKGGGSSGGLFGDTTAVIDQIKSKEQRGEELAQLISDTIEPEIWQANGGEHARIKYFQGKLIITAPLYVHARIGMPTVSLGDDPLTSQASSVDVTSRATPRRESYSSRRPTYYGVSERRPTPVSGVLSR